MWSDDPKIHEECADAIRRVARLHGQERYVAALCEIFGGSAVGRPAAWMATMANAALTPQFFRKSDEGSY